MHTANFLSYNSTGINSIKTNWISDLCKLTNNDFFSIQEQFKSTKNVDKCFKDQFPDTVTLSLLSCAFLPLFKGGLKDPAQTDSYRAITGSSLLLKILDNVILLLWGDRLGTDTLQFWGK